MKIRHQVVTRSARIPRRGRPESPPRPGAIVGEAIRRPAPPGCAPRSAPWIASRFARRGSECRSILGQGIEHSSGPQGSEQDRGMFASLPSRILAFGSKSPRGIGRPTLRDVAADQDLAGRLSRRDRARSLRGLCTASSSDWAALHAEMRRAWRAFPGLFSASFWLHWMRSKRWGCLLRHHPRFLAFGSKAVQICPRKRRSAGAAARSRCRLS
jgi:hypothetical protein